MEGADRVKRDGQAVLGGGGGADLLDHMPYSISTPAKAMLRRRKKKRFLESCCERMFLDEGKWEGGRRHNAADWAIVTAMDHSPIPCIWADEL